MMEEYFKAEQPARGDVALRCASRSDPRVEELLFDETELSTYLRGLDRQVIPVADQYDKLAKSERKPAAQLLSRLLGGRRGVCG